MDIILFKSREVKTCPPHFTKISVASDKFVLSMVAMGDRANTPRIRIRNWLHENIENRFFIGVGSVADSGFLVESFTVAFEDPADATYFSLLLPSFLE